MPDQGRDSPRPRQTRRARPPIVIVVNVAVIGMGLIGGSLLRALAASGHWVIGYDLDPSTRAMARTGAAQAPRDARWQVSASIADAVASADLVVVATPLTAAAQVLDEVATAGFSGLVTDVVSVKEPMRELVSRRLRAGGLRLAGYVGGHPMAGKETAGFAATDPTLFANCAWVLCLDEETSLDDWLTMARLVTSLSARVVPTTAEEHDRVVAAVSHVPHLLAVALASAISHPLAGTLAAGSFRDGTRVAGSSPELIASMTGGNAGPVLDALDDVLTQLDDRPGGSGVGRPDRGDPAVGRPGPRGANPVAARLGRAAADPGHAGASARPWRGRRLGRRGRVRRPYGHRRPPRLVDHRTVLCGRSDHAFVGDDRGDEMVRGHVERRVDRTGVSAARRGCRRSRAPRPHPGPRCRHRRRWQCHRPQWTPVPRRRTGSPPPVRQAHARRYRPC